MAAEEETPEGEESETETKSAGSVAQNNILTKPSDRAARPGFRDNANARSKASKKRKKKKR